MIQIHVRGLFAQMSDFLQEEERAFNLETKQVQQWWTSERFKYVKRPYSAGDGKQL